MQAVDQNQNAALCNASLETLMDLLTRPATCASYPHEQTLTIFSPERLLSQLQKSFV